MAQADPDHGNDCPPIFDPYLAQLFQIAQQRTFTRTSPGPGIGSGRLTRTSGALSIAPRAFRTIASIGVSDAQK